MRRLVKVFSGGSPQLARYPESCSLNSPPSLPTLDVRTDAKNGCVGVLEWTVPAQS